MSIEASIVVEFGEGISSSEIALIELDKKLNIDADGKEKTSFFPGDNVFFLVHYDNSVMRITGAKSSSGMIISNGPTTRTKEQQLAFLSETTKITLSYIPVDKVSVKWYAGNTATLTQDKNILAVQGATPAIGEGTFNIQANSFKLIPPTLSLTKPDDKWIILVVVYMEKI